MIYNLILKRYGYPIIQDGSLIWDTEKKTITGDFTVEILDYIEKSRADGFVRHNILGVQSSDDPLESEEAMNIVLANLKIKIPKELQKFNLKPIQPKPADYIVF